MRRYNLRIAAPYTEVAVVVQSLTEGQVSVGGMPPTVFKGFGLRPVGDGTTDVLLLIDDDELDGPALSKALGQLGFSIDELHERRDAAESDARHGAQPDDGDRRFDGPRR